MTKSIFITILWVGPLVPMMKNLSTTVYSQILEKYLHPAFWQQFEEDLSCFSMILPPCTKQDP